MSTIHLAGDSTVVDREFEGPPPDPAETYCGWGQMLPQFTVLPVVNYARSGRTTETFRTEGHWARMEAALKPGDTALFQFGHNDQKLSHLVARGGYAENLRRYVHETRLRGAVPVLVSSVSRSLWNGPGGTFNDLLGPWARAAEAVAAETGALFLDLHKASVEKVLRWGKEGSRRYFHPGDYTHHNDLGAWEMAELVAGALAVLLPETGRWHVPPNPYAPPLTRAEAVAAVLSHFIILPSQDYRGAFSDVDAADWYAGTVQAAFDRGLLGPWQEGPFQADRVVTREEWDGLVERAAQSQNMGVRPAYPGRPGA